MSRLVANEVGKRAPLNLRVSQEQRDKLDQSAKAHSLSLTQEVMRRLEESFENEVKQDEESGKAANTFLVRMILGSIGAVQARTGRKWQQDAYTATLCEGAVQGVLTALMTPFDGEIVGNRLTGTTPEQIRADALSAGERIGRVFVQDRLTDQVNRLDGIATKPE